MPKVHIYVGRRTTILYAVLTLILIPWIFDIAQNLPAHHVARHWDALWVGFDCMLLIAMLLSTWLMYKGSIWLIVTGSALATLFLVDVWFDILTSRPGREEKEAILFGIIETGLAILTYRLVYHVIRQSDSDQNFKLLTKE